MRNALEMAIAMQTLDRNQAFKAYIAAECVVWLIRPVCGMLELSRATFMILHIT